MQTIPFNKSFVATNELKYITEVINSGLVSGDRKYTKIVHSFMENYFNVPKVLLTTSCSTALDMSAILLNLKENDEVILPSYTFVSTANCICMQKAKPVFVDIDETSLNIDINKIEEKITKKTKAIYPVHYAGCSCDMDKLMQIAKEYRLKVVEDAAQAMNAMYKGKHLGTIGDIGAFSFHETKNFVCGEGGAILLNSDEYIDRAEIIREKGTNRSNFFKGFVDKYTWVDIGGSYLLSDILAAMLYAQIQDRDIITQKRKRAFKRYSKGLESLEKQEKLKRIVIPEFNEPNYHLFYIVLRTEQIRDALLQYLKSNGIGVVFHYIPLHLSQMGVKLGYKKGDFPISESLSSRLIRLPLYADITYEQVDFIISKIFDYFKESNKNG
jgi:dTDP-4-amino-4,6-dideoxygalactose transaminase